MALAVAILAQGAAAFAAFRTLSGATRPAMSLPPGLRSGISCVLEVYPMDTIGDILMGDADDEVQSFVNTQDVSILLAWTKAVAWATAKTEQTKLRIYGEGRRGTGPGAALIGSPPRPRCHTVAKRKAKANAPSALRGRVALQTLPQRHEIWRRGRLLRTAFFGSCAQHATTAA